MKLPLVLLHADREKMMRFMVGLLALITLFILILAGIFFPRPASGQAAIEQPFSQYFNPNIFRAVDVIMKDRSCSPIAADEYWRIWSYGFYRKYKGADGKKFKIVLNWDGFWYRESGSELVKEGDWTLFK